MNSKNIVIIGGGGYVGTPLTAKLSEKNKVKVIDTFWYGNFIKPNKNTIVVKKNIHQLSIKDIDNYDVVIVLGCLSNDPSSELDAKLSYELNIVNNYKIADLCNLAQTKKIIFASSGSVYGLKKNKEIVNEKQILKPISEYNKAKMISERIFISYNKHNKLIIIRPGTVCGYSARMRLDTVLNIFCYQALKYKKITIFGGNQIRPLLNIKDMVGAYEFMINNNIEGIYNVGNDVLKISHIAKIIAEKTNSKLIIKKSNDLRSYRLNSDKIIKKGFKYKFNFHDSINSNLEQIPLMNNLQKKNAINLKVLQKLISKGINLLN